MFETSCLCLQVTTGFPECVVMFFCVFGQINAIKERAKVLSALEGEISKYVKEGREEHKEVRVCCSLVSFQAFEEFLHLLVFAEQTIGASRN